MSPTTSERVKNLRTESNMYYKYKQCCGSGMGKKSGSGSGMNNPDNISESLKNNIFWFKILNFFDVDPGSRMEKIRILDPGWKKVGSGIRDEKKSTLITNISLVPVVKSNLKISSLTLNSTPLGTLASEYMSHVFSYTNIQLLSTIGVTGELLFKFGGT
jgi:hypothetical protein